MPQAILPLFPKDMVLINDHLGVQCRNGIVYYSQGMYPVYMHPEGNADLFRHWMSQLIANGTASSADLAKAFGVNPQKLSRWARAFQKSGDLHIKKKRHAAGSVR